MENFNEYVWSFDIGTGSLGECVRRGDEFPYIASNIIPADFAEIKTPALARRQFRTRQAHKAREAWLDSCFIEWGLEPLSRRKVDCVDGKWKLVSLADPRLEREFPEAGDETCYNSIALRCKLLLGHKLEPWQLYKALNSAIQLRGYDKDIPWKNSVASDKSDEEEETENLEKFKAELENMGALEDYKLPAFFKAWKMGLWSPSDPENVALRIDFNSGRAAGYTIPRSLVEKEVLLLVENASKQYPVLKGKGMYLLYGPSESAYASYYPEKRRLFNLKRGAKNDWQGVLGQKIPRFDNRIIDKCTLIPRLNVCAIKPVKKSKTEIEKLPHETTLLMKLINVRVLRLAGNEVGGLSFEELKAAFEAACKNSFKFTATQWGKFLKGINCAPMANHEEIEPPRESGRSSFSRPAMRLLRELILSGLSPREFHARKISEITNEDPTKGLIKSDLDFLLKMGDAEWSGIYLPDMRISVFLENSETDKEKKIRTFIGRQNDPIVRHRLSYFYGRIKALEEKFGIPERIILEFVRDDFLGPKAKARINKINSDNRKERMNAAAILDEEKKGGGRMLLKYLLFTSQNSQCLYTGENLEFTKLEEYEVDHIVPRSKNGPDSRFNYVLTTRAANSEKGNRTPAEWLKSKGQWQAYVDRVMHIAGKLGHKKVALLTSDNAHELIDKYTSLAETAWMAKLSQNVIAMHFGWQMGSQKGEKRIFVASGGSTSLMRGRYGLNKILLPAEDAQKHSNDLSNVDYLKQSAYEEKKNRENKKHHALDAILISFLPEFTAACKSRKEFEFPGKMGKNPYEYIKAQIDSICPTPAAYEKSRLEETIYGRRFIDGKAKMTVKRPIVDVGYKSVNMKKVYDASGIEKSAEKIVDSKIKNRIIEFSKTNPSEEEWTQWCEDFRIENTDSSKGAKIVKTRFFVGDPTEYKEMSKDGSGAWRKGKVHKGQIVWRSKNGKCFVEPVYAHASKTALMTSLKTRADFSEIVDFFRSGCLVKLDKDVIDKNGKFIWPKGIHKLNTILADGRAKLTTATGVQMNSPVGITLLIECGFSRIK